MREGERSAAEAPLRVVELGAKRPVRENGVKE